MTFIALLIFMQTPSTTPPEERLSAPPLVRIDSPVDPPRYPLLESPVVAPLAPLDNAFHFSPGSLFALFFSVEYERRLTTQLTAFGAFGGSPLGQFGFDLGLRLYPVERAFESFFADARVSGFFMTNGMLLLGPMVEFGYSWRIRGWFLLTVGAGAAMWSTIRPARPSPGFVFGGIAEATVFVVPGLYQPPEGRIGVQPTLRITVGPGF